MLKQVARLTSISAALVLLGAGAAYAQSAEALAAPEEPPPVLPTTGDGGAIVRLLNGVCKPIIEQGASADFEALATAAGMTKNRRSEEYVLPLSQRPFQISMRAPQSSNRNVCEMRVRYAPGWRGPIVEALNVYRFLHEPQLRLQRNEQYVRSGAQETTSTWDNYENQGFDGYVFGLIMREIATPEGSRNQYDEAIIQYAKRPALPEFVQQARAYQEQMRAFEEQQRRAREAGETSSEADPAAPTAEAPAAAPSSAAAAATAAPAS